MQKEKVRIFALARELGIETKDLMTLCRQNGIDVKNQLSTIEPEVRDQVVQLVQKQSAKPAMTPGQRVVPPIVPQKVRVLDDKPKVPPTLRPITKAVPAETSGQASIAPLAPPPSETPVSPLESTVPPMTSAPAAKAAESAPLQPPSVSPIEKVPTPPVAGKPVEPPAHPRPEQPAPAAATPPRPPENVPPRTEPPTPPAAPPVRPPIVPPPVPTFTETRVRHLDSNRSGTPPRRPLDRRPPPHRSHPIAPPAQRKFTPPPEKKPQPVGPKKLAEIPAELLNRTGDSPLKIEDIHRALQQQAPGKIVPVSPDDIEIEEDEEGSKSGDKKPHRRIPGVAGRDERHKARDARQAARKKGVGSSDPKRGVALLEDDGETHRKHRRPGQRIKRPEPTMPRKGKVPISLPITVRALSEAVGVRSNEVISKLMAQGLLVTINAVLEPFMAEAIALDLGCELDVKKQADAEEVLLAEAKKPDNPEDLVLRAPIVTIMGHVDHGKTSLLDRIRHSNVTATEHGGITQVIRAWRVEHAGKPITFLDTPGHEAFTKMRARGAHVTDIAVIVVAADDGVMPQTEEAINHAKASGVSIVVAINKVDLPNANLRKTEQQLYGLGLIPDNMGGEVPFVQTSAATGKGIDDLLETLSVVAELKELKANPNKPASGTCLEANLSEGEGVFATILVQDGTLRKGDVVVCGASSGRVRAMYDDLGRHIDEAGPSVPVRVTGLNEVPNADDPFAVVSELSIATEIAEKRMEKLREANVTRREAVRLEDISHAKIAELKVILKADFRGSIEAIRKELEKLHHEEVRVRVLHAAIGGISESDVQLALTSPQDTIIVGFNVVPDDRALALAEERSVQMRQYNIIYKLTDDIRAALEGKLKPREEIIHLGRAVVRETFKISRVGTIAGCYVTQGTIERSAKVRVIRSGVVVYPPADRTVGLESLKRFKEDVREVREGFECGIKVHGYDDIKVDDVIEAYRIEQVLRTLS
ncbi:MAG TPA: translation initiation factor IF-2 [Gemmataceae bacterium]|nr:translation initiation factor IF-2 [Gemmataceae bacterium]